MSSWPLLAAPLINIVALLLALGFHRNRAVLLTLILTLIAAALAGWAPADAEARALQSTRMFAPWLVLFIAVTPEPSLLSRRGLFLLLTIILAVWLTLGASSIFWAKLFVALPLGWLPWSAGRVATSMIVLAAFVRLLRWIVRGGQTDIGLSACLLLTAIAIAPEVAAAYRLPLLSAAGAMAILTVLYASYRMSFVDALSSLPNRRALDETLARLSGRFALAMVDIDHFKQFNDSHGHAAGDRVLAAVAGVLRRTRGARAFRYGGEEFCLLFTGARSLIAEKSCEETRERVERTRVRIRSTPERRRRSQAVRKSEASEVRVTVSIGVAERNADSRSATEVLKTADQALYRAKGKGRNRVVTL
jgi:diguanylate cyclase (GGDEF)-like protein